MLEVSIYKSHEAFYLLGYKAVSSVERQPMFRRNMFPSLGSKNTPSKKPATADITWLYLLLASRCYLAWLLRPWRRRRHVPQKRRSTFSGLHILAFLKIELFITTAVRTSNPTRYEAFDKVSRASLETDLKKWAIKRTSSTDWLTHSTVKSCSREANRCSASQEILSAFWKPKVHYHVHKITPLVLVHTLLPSFCTIKFNVILDLM
jgi:hypothetical protein